MVDGGQEPANDPVASGAMRSVVPSILRRAHRLSQEVSELEKRHYSSPAPRRLLAFLKAALAAITRQISELLDAEQELGLAPDEFDNIMIRYNHILLVLHNVMSALDRVQVEDTPSELVAPLQYLADRFGAGSELILQASWLLNYTVLDVGSWLESALPVGYQSLLGQLQSHPLLIQFPKAESDNVLLHCVVAHEIAHSIYRHGKLADVLLPKVKLDQAPVSEMIDRLVEMAVSSLEQEFKPGDEASAVQEGMKQLKFEDLLPRAQIRAALNKQLTNAIQSWTEELACDAIAVQLLGLSYLFAFADFVVALSGLDECGETHPPARHRMALMRSMLKDDVDESIAAQGGTPSPYVQALSCHFEHWDRQVGNISVSPQHPLLHVAHTAVDLISNEIILVARNVVPAASNRCHSVEVDRLCEQLELLVPCNEIIDASGESPPREVDLDLILRSAWAFSLAGFPSWESDYGLGAVERDIKLSELALKSLELSNIVKLIRKGDGAREE